MALRESGEMYLETIFVLLQQKGLVRSIDIAEHMNYSKPSVSRAMGLLRQQNYIAMSPEGHITLTAKGEVIGRMIYERHTVLSAVIQALGVDEATATEDACRIEHVISDTTFNAIRAHYGAKQSAEQSELA
ncbi:MAG: metal-dependent transcriptional regulator [Aristaeellaceae bacterium]